MGLRGMRFQLLLVEMLLTAAAAVSVSHLAKHGCNHSCGGVEIPYPFGVSTGCFLNNDFLISCNYSFDPPKPFLRESTIPVTNISIEHGWLQVIGNPSIDCYKMGKPLRPSAYDRTRWYNLQAFTISDTLNKFTVIGCDSYAYIRGRKGNQNYRTGCTSLCDNFTNIEDGSCNGNGCCQIDIPEGLQQINYTAYSFGNHSDEAKFNPCTYAFVAEASQFKFKSSYVTNLTEEFTMVLNWTITKDGTCEEPNNSTDYACKENAECYVPGKNSSEYLCKCETGYQGNPYLSNGCQDINECDHPDLNNCTQSHICENKNGTYTCKCREGYHGDGRKDGNGCTPNKYPLITMAVGVGISFVVVFVIISWLYLVLRKRTLIKLKEKFFQQNGGFLLQQQLSNRSGSGDTTKIFTAEELKKATNNYAENRIIGKGGYGTVYKGFLINNWPVAIKKSKILDESQIEQFVHEVVVLSQINHRNVVRLLGCCLETEVPLLVYEFVNNGTLFEHLHNRDKGHFISWEIRLRIAAETAGVLSYLHSAASTPIIHRDVKSTNILLDHNYTAKVCDFGASKFIPIDETQLSTMVQGTLGYLDPEYLHTSQLTEKSDVYSFGVVLVELLTGKKALLFDRPEEERSLVLYFLTSLKEGRLLEILENDMVNDGNKEQLKEVAEIATMCLRVKGEERPTMKEVAMELDGLRMVQKHSWDNAELLNPEEREYLLCDTSEVHKRGEGSSTTAGYDSIKDHVLVAFDDGR